MTREEFLAATNDSLLNQPGDWVYSAPQGGIGNTNARHSKTKIEILQFRGDRYFLIYLPAEKSKPMRVEPGELPGFEARSLWETRQPELRTLNFLTNFSGY